MFTYLIVTLYLARQSILNLGRIAVLYTLMFTNFNCNLVFSTSTKLVFKPVCSALYTNVYKFNCNLVFSTSTKLALGWIAVLYTLVFTNLTVTLYLAHQPSYVFRPVCSASYTSVYKFICNLVFSTATKLVFRLDCSALYTSVYKF